MPPLAASSLLVMPVLGYAKQRLGACLGSGATAGEGIQNYLCAAQAGAVLLSLAVTATWSGGWWIDPVIGLAIAPGRCGKACERGVARTAAELLIAVARMMLSWLT